MHIGLRVPILYMRTTLGEEKDWVFNPSFDSSKTFNDKRLVDDSLTDLMDYAVSENLSVLFTLNGGVWADAFGTAPHWDLNDHLEEDPMNCQWSQNDEVFEDDLGKAIGGSVDRQLMVDFLTRNGALSGEALGDIPAESVELGVEELMVKAFVSLPGWAQIVMGFVGFPIFVHLWFLWYLLWLVAAFALVAKLMQRFGWRLPSWLTSYPRCLLWLLPLTLVAQFFMIQGHAVQDATGTHGLRHVIDDPALLVIEQQFQRGEKLTLKMSGLQHFHHFIRAGMQRGVTHHDPHLARVLVY